MSTSSPLKMALIGGGGAGFIGKVHVTAATLDRQAELVAGAFSSNPERSKAAASQFGVSSERAYSTWQELLTEEAKRPVGDRVDFLSIATPNFTHAEIACEALKAGFHVVCDKPMTISLAEADRMVATAEASGKVFALSHNYSGYPLARQARQMISEGQLGDIIAVRATYVQGWMHGMDPDVEADRGTWKSDTKKNGRAGSLGDVGTHAFHLAQFVSGLTPARLLSSMNSYSAHHSLDDYGHAMIEFDQGATGMITWSQVSHGRQNDLSLEIDGTQAALAWRQEEPNQMFVRALGQPVRVFERDPNSSYCSTDAAAACRLPGGHPEAFFEAFANVYRNAFEEMRVRNSGSQSASVIYPTVQHGHDGVRFMDRCLASHDAKSAWQAW